MCGYPRKLNVPPVAECDAVFNGVLNRKVAERIWATYFYHQIIWVHVIVIGSFHLAAIYGAYLMLTSAQIYTLVFTFILYITSALGITAGAHRLWSHRAYKAKQPLQILLVAFNTIAHQYSVIRWARDHRVHHKYSETDADPYNAKRGFFFAHVGWLLCKKRPEVIAKGKGMDMSDLENDPLLRFQDKYYAIITPIACFILPTLIPVYLWGETLLNAWFVAVAFRWTFVLNVTWSVNSFAHMFGNHPYDKFIKPVENKSVAVITLGEGWHNYHHTFPWDYKTGELGHYGTNLTTLFIDCMAKIGWAYDLKSVAPESVKRRVERTGDGTHRMFGENNTNPTDVK